MKISSIDFSREVEKVRAATIEGLSSETRAEFGQFFTPWRIAEFMAAMPQLDVPVLKILDPGAGTGVLAAAIIERLCERHQPPESISVTLFERDESLLPAIRSTLTLCASRCEAAGIAFLGEVRNGDFIEISASEIEEFGEAAGSKFNLVIMNPPYRKLRTDSEHRRALRKVGIETSNLYTAFVSLALRLLLPGGELVAITPRSFCNGTYFRSFRSDLLNRFRFRMIHVFERRDQAFGDDQILQENVIFSGVRSTVSEPVVVSCSRGLDFSESVQRTLSASDIVKPTDPEAFIHIAFDENDHAVSAGFAVLPCSLKNLGLTVSTGRVVDFRAKQWLHTDAESTDAPLIYPYNFEAGYIKWPVQHGKKSIAIAVAPETMGLLLPSATYVLVKRFTAKEERRRVVAAVYEPGRIDRPLVGIENHLNYFHSGGRGLEKALAHGLAAYLNSTGFDIHFRQFSGHTQVNATDLRNMAYPSSDSLCRLGEQVGEVFPEQDELDALVNQVVSAISLAS